MPKFNITIQPFDPAKGVYGVSLNVQVDASSHVDAIVKAKPEVEAALEASGLMAAPPAPPAT